VNFVSRCAVAGDGSVSEVPNHARLGIQCIGVPFDGAFTMRILILGAAGMLGNTLFRYFSTKTSHEVFGSVRFVAPRLDVTVSDSKRIIVGVDAENLSSVTRAFIAARPEVVINCIGLIKQLPHASDARLSLAINSVFPHQLADLCDSIRARMIHFSTDCVFSGAKGGYSEFDFADANDLYGRTKFLGEPLNANVVTLRTSLIGHGMPGGRGLVDWFLAQNGAIAGYTKAFFSGLPCNEVARVIDEFILENKSLSGVYHVSTDKISKYDLLNLLNDVYRKNLSITPDGSVIIDRSLDSSKFREITGYTSMPWRALVHSMREFS
jgi:dTDP-4-dehydrorhamnose reductase